MPRPVSELEKPRLSIEDRILEFLRADPTNAYIAIEIMSGVAMGTRGAQSVGLFALVEMTLAPEERERERRAFMQALNTLVEAGHVRVFQDERGESFFAAVPG